MTTPVFQQIITLAEQLTPEERARLIHALQGHLPEETEDEEDTRLLTETLAPYMRDDGVIDFDALEAASLSGVNLNEALPEFIDEIGEVRTETDWRNTNE
jgi:hypothetical protein